MFSPYRKLAKDSVNRASDSCMSWKCIMLASKSARPSESSAKAGSNAFSGKDASFSAAPRADWRNEERDEGRSGVVGRDVRERESERWRLALRGSADMIVAVDCRRRARALATELSWCSRRGSWEAGESLEVPLVCCLMLHATVASASTRNHVGPVSVINVLVAGIPTPLKFADV